MFEKRNALENASLTDDARAETERALNEALARLTEADIDADWLISQRWVVAERREKAATAANPQLDGENGDAGRLCHSGATGRRWDADCLSRARAGHVQPYAATKRQPDGACGGRR